MQTNSGTGEAMYGLAPFVKNWYSLLLRLMTALPWLADFTKRMQSLACAAIPTWHQVRLDAFSPFT